MERARGDSTNSMCPCDDFFPHEEKVAAGGGEWMLGGGVGWGV